MQKTFLRSNYWPGLFVTAALAIFTFVLTPSVRILAASAKRTQTQELKKTDLGELKSGSSAERQLTGTDQHIYRVQLTKGQYVRMVALQKGIDVVLALLAPNGERLSEVDSYGGSDTLFSVAESDGFYRIEVRATDKEAKP